MDLKLAGLNVVITGGSAGIGAAMVETFLKEGANVYFCSRSEAKVKALEDSMQSYPGVCEGRSIDILDRKSFKKWIDEIGAVDIYVPNAATFSSDWAVSSEVDISANMENLESLLPYLKQSQCAAITYIGSIASITALDPRLAVYSASKAAMTHYMKSLSIKLARDGIRVNTIAPGDILIEGGVWDKVKKRDPERYQASLAQSPIGRMGSAQEIANVAVFISSPLASFVNGSTVVVDGARTRHIQG